MRDHKGNAIATLAEVAEMDGLDWRSQLRLAGVEKRRGSEPDRGYIEQPGEGVKPKVAEAKKPPLILPDSQLRRRIEVRPVPATPTACIRPDPDANYEPDGGDEELEGLKAMGRQLEAQNDPGPPALSPELREAAAEAPPTQSLVKLERTPPSSKPAASTAPEKRRYVIYTPEVKAEAVRRVNAGEKAKEVARDMDVTPSVLSLWLAGRALSTKGQTHMAQSPKRLPSRDAPPVVVAAGKLPAHERRARRCWKWPQETTDAMVAAVLTGRTHDSVAAEFDVSPSTVSRVMKLYVEERRKEEMPRADATYHSPKEKLKAVAILRAIQRRDKGERRGQIAEAARQANVPRELLGNWAASGEYEPDEVPEAPKPEPTLMSRPEPQSQPAPQPVSAVQPIQTTQLPPQYYHPAPPMQAPSWGWPQPQPPQPQPAAPPPMAGLKEYIEHMVQQSVLQEVERQLPAALQAALANMWKR